MYVNQVILIKYDKNCSFDIYTLLISAGVGIEQVTLHTLVPPHPPLLHLYALLYILYIYVYCIPAINTQSIYQA